MVVQTMDGGDSTASVGRALAPSIETGPPISGGRGNLPSPPGSGGTLGLARERWNLNAAGLPAPVIDTIQCARAKSTRSLYDCKWRIFEQWCEARHVIPFQCSVSEVLCFLQQMVEKRRAFSTLKVYLAAISACHVGFGDKTVGQHPLISRFMKGARRKLPVVKPLVPLWDLSVVLDALCHHPFEPLEAVALKYVALKTVLLLALTSAKRVSELQAFSVSPTCMQFAPGLSKVHLCPNPAFMPKVEPAYSCPTLEIAAFHPPPFSSPEEQQLHSLCPVRALRVYVDRTAGLRKADQLFVSWASSHMGKPVSSQRLSHWIVEAISLAYTCKGIAPPQGLRAHSTRGVATSWALFRGISVQDICAAASWASPHTFVWFYRLDVSGPSLAQAVLEPRGIPAGAFNKMGNLTLLDLYHNQLSDSDLPKNTFRDLSSLMQLNLAHNVLKKMPPGVPNGVIQLFLDKNRIDSIPKQGLFRGFSHLAFLRLNYNQLSDKTSPKLSSTSRLSWTFSWPTTSSRLCPCSTVTWRAKNTWHLNHNTIESKHQRDPAVPLQSAGGAGRPSLMPRLRYLRLDGNHLSPPIPMDVIMCFRHLHSIVI
ncbi:hypothetical protein WMY93_032661 [Mugilogobius chulae]|uniref:Uncharacterized protein n=1 Tax=Mugilogobius chulae TaxID=88201 RepID=A0AAW0MMJ0_9GOBI